MSQPTALDFTPNGGVALVVNQASNDVTILNAPTRTEIRNLAVGSAPDGIAVSPDGARAYVSNVLSRSVSVVAINPPVNATVVAEVSVTAETLPANVLNGKKLFFTSRGRLSTNNNIACSSCHPDAGHDGRVWLFATLGLVVPLTGSLSTELTLVTLMLVVGLQKVTSCRVTPCWPGPAGA